MNVTYPEFMVAKAIGPKKSVLVQIRRTVLKKTIDWVLVNSVVNYTEAGLVAVCRALELDHSGIMEELKKILEPPPPAGDAVPATSAAPEKNSPESGLISPAPAAAARAVVPEVDIIVTGRSPNPLIVFGRLDDVPVKVRVRNNVNFIPGLVLSAKPGADGLFLMVGHPPRWRGDRIGFTRPSPEPEKSTP